MFLFPCIQADVPTYMGVLEDSNKSENEMETDQTASNILYFV